MAKWTFMTNHATVLICISKHPHSTAKVIASKVAITERSVRRIVADLKKEGYIELSRINRINYYRVLEGMPLRRPLNKNVQIGELMDVLLRDKSGNFR
jgi:predicted transcriptional regulator